MPNTRPTVDPVLDILEEMGYDFDELEGDGYKRSIKEAMVKSHPDKGGDVERFRILNEEWQKLRAGGSRPTESRSTEVKEKRTTIKGIKASKLLPGKGNFSADDIPKAEQGDEESGGGSKVDKIIAFLNGEVKDKLDEINNSIGEIKEVIGAQGDLAEERDEDMRQALLAARKRKREGKLEKKKTVKDKMLESVTKPVENFLGRLIKFVTMTYVGSVVNFILKILKNPMSIFDPILQFFNLIINAINMLMRASFKITGGPINSIIEGINTGVQGLLGVLNNITSKFKIPPLEVPEIPTISGPAQIPFIPLFAGGDVEKEDKAVAMAGGGVVPGGEGTPEMNIDVVFTPGDAESPAGMEGLPGLGGGGGGTDAITMKSKSKSLGSRTKDVGNLLARPFRKKEEKDPRSQFATGFNKGGEVPGSGTGDTVPAMLTPGEFVMSKGAVDQIGVDNLMAMNKDGGGTNVPKMMKFAGGGVVPEIGTPPKKGGKVVVIGGGGGSSAPRGVASSGSSGESRRFSSTDPNNMTIPVVKSLYNIMS